MSVANDTTPTPSTAPAPTVRDDLIELEYTYLTQSSFRSDELRDRIFQFYLLIVSTAAAAILGLTQVITRDARTPMPLDASALTWAFDMLAVFIGAVGLVMLPIFARLRRVVLECLQGTVLLKRYVHELVGDKRFPDAFIWDAKTLPRDEQYSTASFLLVFMMLDTFMLTMPVYLWLSNWLLPFAALLWSLVVAVPLLTLQVLWYRWMLWREPRDAQERNRLHVKWMRLGMDLPPDQAPQLRAPLLQALSIGLLVTGILVVLGVISDLGGMAP